jgi:iron complex transport system substrate-binding protein
MKLDEQIRLWNYVYVKILDVRHVIMQPGERIEHYLLPASSFLYSIRGSASFQLDGVQGEAGPFHMLHGGKGMRLDLEATDTFEYYWLFYRTAYPASRRNELNNLIELKQPFAMQYAFSPAEPLALHRFLMVMERLWDGVDQLEQLQLKGVFYQFVYELLRQMEQQGASGRKPDLAAQAMRYMDEHYEQNLTLESIADTLNYSPGHLSARFKEQTGESPIHYLIQVRIRHAAELLVSTDAPLQQIAQAVGYSDVYYFSRIFKKYCGLSPVRFQKLERGRSRIEDRPFRTKRMSIGYQADGRYIVNEGDNHYQYKRGGSIQMKRSTKSSFALSLLISLTLLLSACSSGGANIVPTNGSPSASPESANTSQAANAGSDTATEAATRIVKTVMGDVEVPANPERVVVLYLLGDVVAMGVKPIGVSDVYDGAAFEQELASVEKLGTWFEVNPEAVLALKPDLIIVPYKDAYDKVKDIAPTVLVPYDELTISERLALLGQTFGKESEAQTLLDNFQAKIAESKSKLEAAGIMDKTVSIIEGGKKEMTVVASKQYGRGSQIIYESLGLKAPEEIQAKIDTATEASGELVSMEVLPKYMGDYIFRSSYEGMDDLSDNPVWSNIPAVKEGRMIELSFGLSYYSDIYSLDKQLDFIMEQLLATADSK